MGGYSNNLVYDSVTSSWIPQAASSSGGQVVDLGSNNDVVLSASATVTGLSTLFDSDGDNTAQACKASAGNLYYIHVYNPNTSAAFLQLFDVASASVTVGTTTPKLSLFIPASGGYDVPLGAPLTFATAITYACTTTATGNGDPTTGLTVNLGYK